MWLQLDGLRLGRGEPGPRPRRRYDGHRCGNQDLRIEAEDLGGAAGRTAFRSLRALVRAVVVVIMVASPFVDGPVRDRVGSSALFGLT